MKKRCVASMNSADIANRQWNEKEREVVRRAARKQRAGDDSGISFDDIPRLTGKQLASMVRLREIRPKVAVSVRVDPGCSNG